MRVYGRIYAEDGSYVWTTVETDANGDNSAVYLTALCQVLQLGYGESPFFSTSGIPAQQSVLTRVFPDFFVNQVQQQYAPYFANLVISKLNAIDAQGNPFPAYAVAVTTFLGATLQAVVPQ